MDRHCVFQRVIPHLLFAFVLILFQKDIVDPPISSRLPFCDIPDAGLFVAPVGVAVYCLLKIVLVTVIILTYMAPLVNNKNNYYFIF